MNPFEPVSSAIHRVDFAFLPSAEIKRLSVKQITNPTTFDSLLHPTPGGLYDKSLGAFEDNACKTCTLRTFTGCPGHCGHIELPTQVYHPIFMDQCLRLLRAQCAFCHRLKIPRLEVNRYSCKLQLAQRGLIKEAGEIDVLPAKPAKTLDTDMLSSEDEKDTDAEDLMVRRNKFVRAALRKARENPKQWDTTVTEAVAQCRRETIAEFLAAIASTRKCHSCNAISPTYRKDKYTKIFRTDLSAKEAAKNVQLGVKMDNPLIALTRERRAGKTRERKRKRADVIDEGIADVDSSQDGLSSDHETSDDSEVSANDMLPGAEDQVGVLVAETATQTKSKDKGKTTTRGSTYMSALEVHAALTLLFDQEKELLALVYSPRSTTQQAANLSADMFFIDALLVPPTRFRPVAARGGSDALTEHASNTLYKNVLNACGIIKQINEEISGAVKESGRRLRTINDLQNAVVLLQGHVNNIIDATRNPQAGRLAEDGIKQLLEKKEGLFRKNMMGKRVNFAARSVISPDPNLETSEIGVPPVFAKKLNYAEPVTPYNFQVMKSFVLNGADKYPGAVAIEDESGRVVSLKGKSVEERMALANSLLAPSNTSANGARNKKVHRHLQNGDMVIMNRQPTLHKPSMMCHRARVLPGEKTIRMHYANCNTYNADFDGDEMNMHFPQNEIARAEAVYIADTDHQYLSATAGKPLRGLIQDHISMGLQLTNRDVFYNREEYQQLLYSAIRPEAGHTATGSIVTVPPAILKPEPLWTGKQIVSTLLKNITPVSHVGLHVHSKSQTPAALWADSSEEQQVIVVDGELVCGVLDKSQIGPAVGGIVHSVHEAYGERAAGRFLSLLGRMLTKVLHQRAFSCGVEDLILTMEGESTRQSLLKKAPVIGLEVASKYVTLEDRKPNAQDAELKHRLEDVLRDDAKQRGLDDLTKAGCNQLTSEISLALLPDCLIKPFPKNQMQSMTGSGAKGSSINANLISCNLGQQVLEGRRVPTMSSGKTLPSFVPFDTNIRAGGYITQRFLTGIKPQEYYFHAMAGREGLIDTAVKTSRSGYLQRCLVKGLENMKVDYDSTVRDSSSGDVVQFLYGEDGLDVARAKNLNDFKWIANNFMSVFEQLNTRQHFEHVYSPDAEDYNKKAVKVFSRSGDLSASGLDPSINVFSPARYCGSTSEKFYRAYKKYRDDNPDNLLKDKKKETGASISKKNFDNLMIMKYQKALVEPGESVGIVAGQSVGEPSTQMTLNTFHLAGHSSKNVTLGIPRLREIVMTASRTIGTPQMTLYINEELGDEGGRQFAKGISRLSLAEIMDSADVKESVGRGTAYQRARIYRTKLNFFPPKEYCKEYGITVTDILGTVIDKFLPKLQVRLRLEMKKIAAEAKLDMATDARPDVGQSSGRIEEQSARAEELDDGDGEDDDEGGDGDTDNAKQSSRRKEMVSYEDGDVEEEQIRLQAQRDAMPEEEDEAYGSRENTPDPEKIKQAPAGQSLGPTEAEKLGEEDEGSEGDINDPRRLRRAFTETPEQLEERVKAIDANRDLTTFKFDPLGRSCAFTLEYPFTAHKPLMLSHVEAALKDAVIQALTNINTAFYVKDDKKDDKGSEKEGYVVTEGINIPEMWEYQHIINPHRINSNSVAHMLQHYGVEAARSTIIQELRAVFDGHGISVDVRHLSLIADTMTRAGSYKAFNRSGLMKDMVSAFAKMSFETTVGFLKDAVLEGEREDLRNPSARIVVGKLSGVGTGGFDVLTRVGGIKA